MSLIFKIPGCTTLANMSGSFAGALSKAGSFASHSVATLKSSAGNLAGCLGRGTARLTYPIRKPVSDYVTRTTTGTFEGAFHGFAETYLIVQDGMKNCGFGTAASTGVALGSSIVAGSVCTAAGFISGSFRGCLAAIKDSITLKNVHDAYSKKSGTELTQLECVMILPLLLVAYR